MSKQISVNISNEILDIQEAYDFVCDPAHGAVDLFIGAVRNHHEGQSVEGITYDVHDALAKQSFEDIAKEACNKWKYIKTYIAHYKGELPIGGISIIIAVSSAHRAESFDACRYIIEEIKKRSPIWKQEHYEHGRSEWLPGHSLR